MGEAPPREEEDAGETDADDGNGDLGSMPKDRSNGVDC
jgi:hypothetical protein